MSMPRLGFTSNMFCAMNAFTPLGIQLRAHSGAFWHAGIDQVITDAINEDFDVAFLVDYDTVFTPKDVEDLLRLYCLYEKAQAIVPLQAKRDSDDILASFDKDEAELFKEKKEELFKKDLVKIKTGHMGLALIDLHYVKALPKPWFVSLPDSDGEYKNGKVIEKGESYTPKTDADIWFWRLMEREGLNLYLAPKVKVGHIQQVVTYPDNNLQPTYCYLSDAIASNKVQTMEWMRSKTGEKIK